MNRRIEMVQVKQLLRMRHEEKKSDYKVGLLLGISKNTVKVYYKTFQESGLSYEEVLLLEDNDLIDLLGSKVKEHSKRFDDLMSELPGIEKELTRKHVDRRLVWTEYRLRHPDGYGYTQFCYYIEGRKKCSEASIHLEHKAGEKMFIDFTGSKLQVVDRVSGEAKNLEVFVAILPCSQLTYIEVVRSQKEGDFIMATGNALKYFGGVPDTIVPDNLKSAVTKADRYEPEINRNFSRFGEHYNTAIIPARARHPKDKAYVEGAVKILYRRVFAPLRNKIFYNIEDLNEAVSELLEKHNDTTLTGRQESRRELFNMMEKTELKPLPDTRYSVKKFELKRVSKFYQVQLKEDKFYYSVPYKYIGENVEVIYSMTEVEVYFKQHRIAYHKRSFTKKHSIIDEHMPPAHQANISWNKEQILTLASTIGPETEMYIKKYIESKSHPVEAFKCALGIISFGKESKYGKNRLNNACKRGLRFNSLSLKTIEIILQKGLDKEEDFKQNYNLPEHENVRQNYH